MKVAINCGHTKSGKGYGAHYKGWSESKIVREVGDELIKQLRKKGYRVYECTVDQAESQNAYLRKTCRLANDTDADLFISLHLNASSSHKGHGCEVYTWKGREHEEAVNICSNLEDLGFKSRGVKDGSKMYVIKHTKAKAVLVELFFLDNETDRNLYEKLCKKEIARAIAKAL